MGLRGKKPQEITKRLKAFFYGNAKVGKTTAAIQFPKPYIIDTERGCENKKYSKLIDDSGGAIFQTQDFQEIINEIKSLLSVKHEYKTLVIDSLTPLYNNLVDKCADEIRRKSLEKNKNDDITGTEFGRHISEANKRMKRLIDLLYRLDMNVIITSHAKEQYNNKMEIIGTTFDCFKKMDYMFDLILEIQKRSPTKRVAIVKGSRFDEFKELDTFDFNYEEIAKRYGTEILEKDSVAENLATKNQVEDLLRLIDLLKVPEETVQKWLDKANSETIEEMNMEAIQKCIDYLKSKITGVRKITENVLNNFVDGMSSSNYDGHNE